MATLEQVRIIDGCDEVARHSRSFDKAQQIEKKEHIEALIQQKKKARKLRGQDRLIKAIPNAQQLLNEAALRGDNLGSITSTLLRYLDQYGQSELSIAIDEALNKGVPHPNAVRQTLQKRREERDQPPPLSIVLPHNEKARNLVVKPHTLTSYDDITSPESKKGEDHGDKNR
jgi:hypothetical protein